MLDISKIEKWDTLEFNNIPFWWGIKKQFILKTVTISKVRNNGWEILINWTMSPYYIIKINK